jgi:hypothetical protein
MKKFNLILTVLFLTSIALTSCKYEEGPGISLISKRDRLANEWSVVNYKINNEDNAAALNSFKSGDSVEHIFSISRSGYFSFGPQYTKAFSKANNNKIMVYNDNLYELFNTLNENTFIKNAATQGRWSFTERHDKVVFGNNGNGDLSKASDAEVLICDIVQLKNKELKISFTAKDGTKHLMTMEPRNSETPAQRVKNGY